MTYDRAAFVDDLFPNGRPECVNHDGRPVYLAGKCSDCFAAEFNDATAKRRNGRERTTAGFRSWAAERLREGHALAVVMHALDAYVADDAWHASGDNPRTVTTERAEREAQS